MNKVIKWLKTSNHGKHIYCGFLVSIGIGIFIRIGVNPEIMISFVAGMCLEYKDKAHGGKFDIQDLIATILGGVIAAIIVVLTKSIISNV